MQGNPPWQEPSSATRRRASSMVNVHLHIKASLTAPSYLAASPLIYYLRVDEWPAPAFTFDSNLVLKIKRVSLASKKKSTLFGLFLLICV